MEITKAPIHLMERLGIETITVKKEKGTKKVPLSNAETVDLIKKEAALHNKEFDAEDYLKALNQIEISPEDLESVLIGEGNVSIDEKHQDLVEHTQKAFHTFNIKYSDLQHHERMDGWGCPQNNHGFSCL